MKNLKSGRRGLQEVSTYSINPADPAETLVERGRLEIKIGLTEAALADIEKQIKTAEHTVSMHRTFYGAGSHKTLADQAIVETLQIDRAQLARELREMRAQLGVVVATTGDMERRAEKQQVIESEPEIRAAAAELLAAVEAAVSANERYYELRRSVARAKNTWPYAYAPLKRAEINRWLSELEIFLKEKK